MEGQNFIRIVQIALVMFLVSTGIACSSAPQSPFHMYNTPLLEADGQHVYARERGFDPMNMGDFSIGGGEAYAVQQASQEGEVVSTKVVELKDDETSQKATPEKKRPSLSTTRNVGAVRSKRGEHRVEAKEAGAPADAAEYVWTTYAANGVEFEKAASQSVSALYKSCKKGGAISHDSKPQIGDIAFFHNTHDLNDDGRNNDWYTLAGIVESVDSNGGIVVLAWMGDEVERFTLNLESERVADDSGNVVNARLRKESSKDAPFTQYFAHELFAGFCGALGDKPDLLVLEEWSPTR